jgi:hypothetical protein
MSTTEEKTESRPTKRSSRPYDHDTYMKYREYYLNYYKSKPKVEREYVKCNICNMEIKYPNNHNKTKTHNKILEAIGRTDTAHI